MYVNCCSVVAYNIKGIGNRLFDKCRGSLKEGLSGELPPQTAWKPGSSWIVYWWFEHMQEVYSPHSFPLVAEEEHREPLGSIQGVPHIPAR